MAGGRRGYRLVVDEVMEATGVTGAEWATITWHLLEEGRIERKGRRYCLVSLD